MKHRTYSALLASALVVSCAAEPAKVANPCERIPPYLVGMWASDGAVLRGAALIAGTAVYLGADGAGALAAGPPAIGVGLRCEFNEDSGALVCEQYDGYTKQRYGQVSLHYNRATQKLEATADRKTTVITRRFDTLSDAVRRGIGLPPTVRCN